MKLVTLLLGAVLCMPINSAFADAPKPFARFESKRVKATSRKSKLPRITIQIDPAAKKAAEPVVAAKPDTKEDAPKPKAKYAWFWDAVPSDLAKAGPGRLDGALQTLSGATERVSVARLQRFQDMTRAHGVDILTATVGTDVSPALVLAVMMVESAGKTDAVSSAGAQGLMQLMPATAERFGVTDSFSTQQNISGGVKYLDWLMKEFNLDPIIALAGYNAGEGAVRKHQGVPPYSETQDYVPKVLAAYQVARGLCLTPPQLASDGCVFAAMN
jgi:soluble lytic murein transglycosylase-like protein